MYTIKRAAEQTGVPVATLRAWERRYGVVSPARTESGYRVYDEEALRRLTRMRDLVAQGWAPKQAAEQVLGDASAPGGERGPADPGDAGEVPADAAARFVDAAARLDGVAIAAVLDEVMAHASFEAFADGWLMPALTELGEAWSRGTVSVSGEHLAAHAVLRRLAAAYEAAGRPSAGHPVLIGLPAGAHHELGALAFATAARRQGVDVLYTGPDLPADGWVDGVRRHGAVAAVVAVPMGVDVPAAQEAVDALRAADPDLLVAVGGAHHGVLRGALGLGHTITGGAARLVAELTDRDRAAGGRAGHRTGLTSPA
ncbi:MerR family transcriptional regulator [Ornithinicoccus hortensis]|uniref:B12 binding protein n=1 Tax=Ornithinicoccus hortensis TaxID=82346 RepID=A0A542YQQ2_9MICO|nr:MerR family transcriptional regulator [Ornithinicoccus hortensis]TQL50423.1 B12 binding protein [Ornithinicoccus hortensis]